MRTTTKIREAAGLGALALACFGAVVDCGSGSSGNAAPSGHGDSDAGPTVGEVREGADGGAGPADGALVESPPPRQACQSAASCTDPTMTCCSGFCVDIAADPTNCGSCGNVCNGKQFCTGTKCDALVVANVCDNPKATVSMDQYMADNTAGAAIGAGLATACAPPVNVAQLSQDADGVLDPLTERPKTGVGNTFVTGGGGYGQLGDHYLDSRELTQLYVTADGVTEQIVDRSAGTNLANAVDTDLTAHHDYFYVQLTVEPVSGTLCFMGVGMLQYGTAAAGYFVPAVMIPGRAQYTDAWYVYEWTDTNGDAVANAGDTFTLIKSGQ